MLFLLPLHTSSIDLSVGRSHAIRHQFSRSHDLPNFAVYDHVMSLLKEPHWLRVPERIEFKLCALVYKKCLNGSGPAYLADSLQQVTDAQLRQRLRSSSSSWLVVPVTRHATLGDRAWNALSDFVSHGSANRRIILCCAEDLSLLTDNDDVRRFYAASILPCIWSYRYVCS